MEFNKEAFGSLTQKAMKQRKPAEFAKTLQIKQGYLESIINGLIQSPPKMDVIKKIAKESEGRVKCEELFAAAGIKEPVLPNIKPLSERVGKWEILYGRKVNLKAFRQYILMFQGDMNVKEFAQHIGSHQSVLLEWLKEHPLVLPGEETMEQICSACQITNSYEDFMKTMGFTGAKYRIFRGTDLTPDKIEIPKEILEKNTKSAEQENKEQETESPALVITESTDKHAETQATDNEISIDALDLAELAVLRFLKGTQKDFSFCGSDADKICVKMDAENDALPSAKTLIFDLAFVEKSTSREDVLMYYGKLAVEKEANKKEFFVVTGSDETYAVFTANRPENLRCHLHVIYIKGAKVIKDERL